MKLYTDEGNFKALKLFIGASLSNVKLSLSKVKPEDKVIPHQNPSRYPALELASGSFISSSNAACRFLLGTKDVEEPKVDQWVEWEADLLQPLAFRLLLSEFNKNLDKDALNSFQSLLKPLEDVLSPNITGASLTAADICVWCALYPFFGIETIKGIRDGFPKISAWFDRLGEEAAFKSALQQFPLDPASIKTYVKSSPAPLSSQAARGPGRAPCPCSSTPGTPGSPPSETPDSQPAVTQEEMAEAELWWREGANRVEGPKERVHPVLPKEGAKNVLITSALPYVNNVPHLGNIIGCVLSADVFSRYCRLRNYNSLYVCGTDEYGTATETKAMEEGLTPQQICDKYNKLHREIYEWFNIGFDYFGRTTTSQQTKIAQDIFWKLQENDNILKDNIEQLKCEKCDKFLADRFVEGTCPLCNYDDARGDQCDKCGKLINAVELKNPRCKMCSNAPVVKVTSHLFMDLPKLEPLLVKHLDKEFESKLWSNNTKVITRAWLRDGLKPRCISRDLKWGTPVPLDGYTDKVFYVWYDAPIGYISITANYTTEWERWWKNPRQVELCNFMAKDNVPFHSVIFPCTLLGTGENWTVVNYINATEYFNYEDAKFSKSRGVGVFGNDAHGTGIPADIWRFYLLYLRPEGQDSAFSWDDFVLKNNSELLNNLGNFINRALMFVNNSFKGLIPEMTLQEEEKELMALITRELKSYLECLELIKLRDAIRHILNISRLGNQYIQANKPWVLVKGTDDEKTRAGTIVGLAANISCLLSVMLHPYMPTVGATIQTQLEAPAECNYLSEHFVCYLNPGHKIGKPSPLFQKIDPSVAQDLRKKFAGKQTPVAGPEDVERLTKAVADQGDKVRKLKGAKAPKSEIDAEVKVLLDLKKQLAAAQGQEETPSGGNKKKEKGQKGNDKPVAGPEDVERLTKAVADQGDKVRKLKGEKAPKLEIDAEVKVLLDLKKQLAAAQGQDEAPPGGNKKGKGQKGNGKGGAPAPADQAPPNEGATTADPAEAERLTKAVTEQGDKVRELKAAKADKSAIDAEVSLLLDLKRKLAISQGQDPNQTSGGGKKKKGKKK